MVLEHVKAPAAARLWTVFLAALFLQVLSVPPQANQASADEGAVLNSLLGYLNTAGYDLSNTVVVAKHDPTRPVAWSNHLGPFSAISLNLGLIQQFLDLINGLYGLGFGLNSPEPSGFMLFVLAHEHAHINCCHETTSSVVEYACDELLAHVNGSNAACAMVAALFAAATQGGQPLGEAMSKLLHTICRFIDADRDKFNNDPSIKEAVAGCVSKEANGEYSHCRCSDTSWDPPKADPCGDCPGFPDPGDPGDPYPDGIIPRCDACDHI